MPHIEINEKDLTSAGNRSQENDVVYIPGLVDINQDKLYAEGEYIGLKPFEPTYIEDLSTFKTLVGDRGVIFEEDQLYTDLIEEIDDEYFGFDENAIPYSKVMFRKGQVDPSYVMAKELLAAGLPIVYERINKDPELEEVTSEPAGWNELDNFGHGIYENYFEEIEGFKHIQSTIAPKLFVKYTGYDEEIDGIDLYEREDKDGVYTYSKTAIVSSTLTVPESKTYYYRTVKLTEPKGKTYLEVHKPESLPLRDIVSADNIYELILKDDGTEDYNQITETPSDWGIRTYYTKNISYEKVKDNDPEDDTTIPFEAGKYYISDDNNQTFELVTDETNWDPITIAYYTQLITYEAINYLAFIDPKFKETKYRFREDLDLYVKVEDADIKDDEGQYEYDYSDLFTFTIYPQPSGTGKYIVRKDFINKFNEYCEKTSSLESLEDKVFFKFEEADNKIYANNTYSDIKSIYDSLSEVFSLDRDNGLTDMGNVNIKYITSGGYPTYEYRGNEIATKMIQVAKTRGDAVAFIDHTNNSDRTTNMSESRSLYAVVKNDSSIQTDGEFGTMFTPYMNFVRTTKDDTIVGQSYNPQIEMSGTYAYLMCLANSIKVNPAWLAVAGAARGLVPNLQQVATNTPISNGNADKMQPRDGISINAITEIKPYGYTIWGNRTLKNNGTAGNLKATSFLNIRNLVCDIKKVAYSTARALTFEQNNDILWINFQSKLTPTLDRMKSGYGISGYKIVRNTEHEKANEKATLCANIIIYPTYAVEDFYITVVLTDDEVGVEE